MASVARPSTGGGGLAAAGSASTNALERLTCLSAKAVAVSAAASSATFQRTALTTRTARATATSASGRHGSALLRSTTASIARGAGASARIKPFARDSTGTGLVLRVSATLKRTRGAFQRHAITCPAGLAALAVGGSALIFQAIQAIAVPAATFAPQTLSAVAAVASAVLDGVTVTRTRGTGAKAT